MESLRSFVDFSGGEVLKITNIRKRKSEDVVAENLEDASTSEEPRGKLSVSN